MAMVVADHRGIPESEGHHVGDGVVEASESMVADFSM
jgi:hypothetical protein